MSTHDHLESMAAALSHSDQADRLAEALADVPAAIRASSPYHLMFHGDLLALDRAAALSDELYRRALALNPEGRLRAEIAARLYAAVTRLGKRAEADELAGGLPQEAAGLSAYGRALWFYSQGVWHWRLGDVDAARTAMTDVLTLAGQGDRRVAFTQFRARYALSAAAIDQADSPEASLQTQALLEMGLSYGFQANLLAAFGQRLYAEQLDSSHVLPLAMFLEVPGEAFDSPDSGARFDFVTCFGIRAIRSRQLALAHSVFAYLSSEARRASLKHRSAIAEFWLMHVLAFQGAVEAARRRLDDLRTMSTPRRFQDNLLPAWAALMFTTGRTSDAVAALDQVDDLAFSDDDRSRVRLYRLAASMQAGDAGAAAQLRHLLERPEGERLRRLDGRLVRRMGLAGNPPPLSLKLLGQPCLERGDDAIEFPRRKILSLFALLTLHPEGLSNEELVAKLFPETDDLEPLATLRKTVYQARQVLKALDVPDPIEHRKGSYRLRRAAFDVCDVCEFEQLHDKAVELESLGHRQGARIFHRFVVWMGASVPFDGLPEPVFVEPRARLQAMLERSRAFMATQDVPPSEPALAWSDGWKLVEGSLPDLARRIREVPQAWAAGDEQKARADSDALLIETSLGDRSARVAHGLVLAMRCLIEMYDPATRSLAWTERLDEHARRHPGLTDPLMVHAIGLHSRILEEGGGVPLRTILAVPSPWLAFPDTDPWSVYQATFGHHFIRAGQPEQAGRIFARLRADAPPALCPVLEAWLSLGETVSRAPGFRSVGTSREPLLQLTWFGEPAVKVGEEAIAFPRKKCLALLAVLALHPQGLGVEALHSLLYPEARHSNAKKTIYTLVATTRRALDARGGAHLIESRPGYYRLRGEAVVHDDLEAHDLFHAKGTELEHLGYEVAARLFHQMASDLAERGPLFKGLHEPYLERLRRAHAEQARPSSAPA